MKPAVNFIAGILLAAFALSAARALETFPASDPRFAVQTVIALTDKHALPDWSEPSFQTKLRPYLTASFLAAVARGGVIASKKGINLYDGEFFTGSQDLAHALLFSASVTKQAGDVATVDASVGTTDDPKAQPKTGDHIQYRLKRIAGVWKIDDFRNLEDYAKTQPSVKTLFSDPVKYGQ